PARWLDVIFNASFPFCLVHTVTGFYLTTAFAVLAVTAWHLKRAQHLQEAQRTLRMTVFFIAIFVPVQNVVGVLQGGNTLEHQPVKLASTEGLWESRSHVPMVLFAIPDQ